jgi:hypothetical protein
LKSGFERSNVLKRWDHTESNEFLYATSEKEVALEMAFGSLLESTFDVKKYSCYKPNIVVTLDSLSDLPEMPLEALKSKSLFLYTIHSKINHDWIKVNNDYNNLETEWKTKATISQRDIFLTQEFKVSQFLKQYKVRFV